MNNKEMIEYKPNLISKIRSFFRKLFHSSNSSFDNTQIISRTNDRETDKSSNKKDFIAEIKIDTNDIDKVYKKKEFLDEINGNEEALNMLSVDRLKELSKYYDQMIEQNNLKIQKLKANT